MTVTFTALIYPQNVSREDRTTVISSTDKYYGILTAGFYRRSTCTVNFVSRYLRDIIVSIIRIELSHVINPRPG